MATSVVNVVRPILTTHLPIKYVPRPPLWVVERIPGKVVQEHPHVTAPNWATNSQVRPPVSVEDDEGDVSPLADDDTIARVSKSSLVGDFLELHISSHANMLARNNLLRVRERFAQRPHHLVQETLFICAFARDPNLPPWSLAS